MGRVADLYESERLFTMVADAALIGLYYQSLLSHWSFYVYFPKIVFRDGVFLKTLSTYFDAYRRGASNLKTVLESQD